MARSSDIALAIVVPMANEKVSAIPFLRDVLAEVKELREVQIFVIFDRACRDGTKADVEAYASEETRVRVIWAPENQNVVDAYVTGYRAALASGADWILEIDAGYSHRPDEIPRFINTMAAGYDCAFGTRFGLGGKMLVNSKQRYFVSKGGTILTNLLLGTRLTDMTSGFQMFTHEALTHVLEQGILSQGPFFQTEMKFHCRRMKIAELPITYEVTESGAIRRNVLTDAVTCLIQLFYQRINPL